MNKKRGATSLKVLATTLLATVPLVGISPAHAGANNAAIPSVVHIPRGGHVTLPLEDVTRVVPDDDDIARGSFVNGKAVLEGVTVGDTKVEIYQKNNQRRLVTVQVQEASQLTSDTAQTQTVTTGDNGATSASTGGNKSGATIPALPATTPDAPVLQPVSAATQTNTFANSIQQTAANITPSKPGTSPLFVSLGVTPAEDNPSQALFTITFGNQGADSAQGVKLHYALDDLVSYVPNSATGDVHYDAAARELIWNVGILAPNSTNQKVSFRIQPIDQKPITFYSVATVEDASNVSVSSNTIKYFSSAAPLLTVFALPDRFLAGRNAPVLVDVKGVEFQTAIDHLQKIGVISGVQPGIFQPARPTQRAEYAVMTLNGLNIRDLRDLTVIKFVLGRRSTVNLNVLNSAGKVVAPLIKNVVYETGEKSAVWDGRSGTGFAAPGRYTYVCTAKDVHGETQTLQGTITIVPQTPLEPNGRPSFIDVHTSDWYAGYLALAEKQGLVNGYPGKLFHPERTISRAEATAIIVRALGLEDLTRQKEYQVDAGFLDYNSIPDWAVGYINVASQVAKTSNGKLIVGYPGNLFLPLRALRRDEAALIVQRLINKETDRTIHLSGQLAPGATVSIDGQNIQPADDGRFETEIKQNTAQPPTVAIFSQQR